MKYGIEVKRTNESSCNACFKSHDEKVVCEVRFVQDSENGNVRSQSFRLCEDCFKELQRQFIAVVPSVEDDRITSVKSILQKRDCAFDGQEFGASYCDLDNIIEEIREAVNKPAVKVVTRHEYYTSFGFSGSTIDRPDDPIDDDFIKHCEGLRSIAEGFIDHCKKDSANAKSLSDKNI